MSATVASRRSNGRWTPVAARALAAPATWVTASCGALGLLVGLPSVWYPLGRDQGLFYYVAREWLLRGQVLYRDLWDHKPPVIYFVYMTALAFFGEHPWSIRLLELLVAVPALGWCAARLTQELGERARADLFAVGWVGVAVCYYVYFIYWDTAQCELWSALFAALALFVARHGRRFAAAAAGAFCAIALFTKPPVVSFVLLCGIAIARRAFSEGGARAAFRRLLEWIGGNAAVAAAMLAYFAVRGALADMMDILVGANAVYVSKERTFDSSAGMLDATVKRFATMEPYSAVFAVVVTSALLAGLARRDRALIRRYAWPAALALAACVAVVMQLKFYQYHWAVIAPAAGVFAVTLYGDALRLGAAIGRTWLASAAYVATMGALFLFSGAPARGFLSTSELTLDFVSNRISRATFARAFDIPTFFANYDADLTGRWLMAHANPGDTLVVRGFEPEIYATSGMHFTGRFFWTAFLTMPTRRYRRSELLDEDCRAIVRDPPRFAVALTAATRGIDSAEWLEHLGYERRVRVGSFTVLEHAP